MTIDWEYLKNSFNSRAEKRENICYKTPKDMLAGIYDKIGTTNGVAKELLISRHTAWKKMKDCNIQLKDKGWRGRSKCLDAIKALGHDKIKTMTCKQTAITIKFSVVYTRIILDKHGFEYIKFWEKRNHRKKRGEF